MPAGGLVPTKDLEWGKLVKSWATGVNQFDATKPAPPRPKTKTELKAQCAALGITLNIPEYVTNETVEVIQFRKDTLTIRLPPKELVEEFEAALLVPGTTYTLPLFYERDIFRHPPQVDSPSDVQACRIGDYSIGMCQ